MSHPYEKYESTKIWHILNKGLSDLVENQDVKEATDRAYIVGYLCKLLDESGVKITPPGKSAVVSLANETKRAAPMRAHITPK